MIVITMAMTASVNASSLFLVTVRASHTGCANLCLDAVPAEIQTATVRSGTLVGRLGLAPAETPRH